MTYDNRAVTIERPTVAVRGEGKDSKVVTIPSGATVRVTGYDDVFAKCIWAGGIVYVLKSVIEGRFRES